MLGRLLRVIGTVLVIAVAFVTPILVTSAPVSAATTPAQLNSEVSGPFTGTSTLTISSSCLPLPSGEGQTVTATYTTSAGTGSLSMNGCITIGSTFTTATFAGTFALTAPDGATLQGTAAGTEDIAAGTTTISAFLTLTPTSGTSEFAGVTGTVILTGTFPATGGPGTAAISGSLGGALNTSSTAAPSVSLSPQSQSVTEGTSVTFIAVASGNPTPTLQWQQSTDGGTTWSDISGATSDTYTIASVPLSDNGSEFEAVFTNSLGSATTAAATLTVTPGVAPAVTTQPTSQSVVAGTSVSLTAAASGNPTPTVQWQQSSDGGTTWTNATQNITGSTSTTYSIVSVPLSDNGFEFRAIFTNVAGSATTNPATLTVTTPPPPTTSVILPANGATVSGSIWLDGVASSPIGIASITYEVSGGSVSNQVVGSGTLTEIGYLGVWDTHDVPNGTYTLQSVATDTAGQSTTSAPVTVTVDNPPLQTAVVVPANGATVSGGTWLDASANGTSDVTGVQYFLSGGSLSNQLIATATATLAGWLAGWNSASVPNGTYTLQSVATEVGGTTATSPGITITVAN